MRGNPIDGFLLSDKECSAFDRFQRPDATLTAPLLSTIADINSGISSDLVEDNDGGITCCRCSGFGCQLSPFLLLLVFIYVNLLNYVDRGLVNGVLPTYCVNCPHQNSSIECSTQRSCMWETDTSKISIVSIRFVQFMPHLFMFIHPLSQTLAGSTPLCDHSLESPAHSISTRLSRSGRRPLRAHRPSSQRYAL